MQAQETDNVKEIRSTSKSKTVVPANINYNKAKKFKRFLLGDHYRKEWAEPVEVEVLDLETQAGGLMPVRIGGGLQTKSLRLAGADGKEYTFHCNKLIVIKRGLDLTVSGKLIYAYRYRPAFQINFSQEIVVING